MKIDRLCFVAVVFTSFPGPAGGVSCERSELAFLCLQRGQEGDLMQTLSSQVSRLPALVTSAFVLESTARFGGDPVTQLLDPQSAVNHLLSQGNPLKTVLVDMYLRGLCCLH